MITRSYHGSTYEGERWVDEALCQLDMTTRNGEIRNHLPKRNLEIMIKINTNSRRLRKKRT